MDEYQRLILQLGKASVGAHARLEPHQRRQVEAIICEVINFIWQAHIKKDPGEKQYSEQAMGHIDLYLGTGWRDIDSWDGV